MKKKNELAEALVLVIQFGLSLLVPIIVCTLIGWQIGKNTNANWIIILSIVIGIVAGINGAYRQVKKYTKDEKRPGQLAREKDEKIKYENDNKQDETTQ